MTPQTRPPRERIARARGTLVGLLAGDAFGAQVEFRTAETIAQDHPGGLTEMGPSPVWHTAAGQPTDDGELALALCHALIAAGGRFDADTVRAHYRAWLDSEPFDTGTTTLLALRGCPQPNSESNDALMRVAPIGILYANAGPESAAHHAALDAQLTHPNEGCAIASAIMARLVATAITTAATGRTLYEHQLHRYEPGVNIPRRLHEAMLQAADAPPTQFSDCMSWAALTLHNALYWLARDADPEQAIVETVACGGDTDTNAAVCGALLGALHGVDAIPERWRATLRTCRPGSPGTETRHPRPRKFWPGQAEHIAETLLDLEPPANHGDQHPMH